jgi:hypothetical protein
LTQAPRPTGSVLLVTDERQPLKRAAKGQAYFDELGRRYGTQFQHVALTFDQYADLEALHTTVGLARSGDLEIEVGGQTRRVSEREVLAALHHQDRYATHPLLRLLLGGSSGTAGAQSQSGTVATRSEHRAERPGEPTEDQEMRQFIMAQLALMPGASSQELAIKYAQYARLAGRSPVDPALCRPQLEEVARAMHQEKLVNVTPSDDGIYLLPRRR